MKKKIFVFIFASVLLVGFQSLEAADIKGKISLLPKGDPYSQGYILLRTVGEENYLKTEIDPEGYYSYTDLRPGKYEIKMDLFNLTTFQDDIEIFTDGQIFVRDYPISLSLLDKIHVFIKKSSDFVWFPVMVILLLGTGVILTIFCQLIQVRRLILSIKMVFQGALHKDGFSHSPLKNIANTVSFFSPY